MEFSGFIGSDFDFFKKKEKMVKEDYDKGRNNLKIHFRSFCYQIQKVYYQKTGSVLYLEKEFQNFNKRSNEISVERIDNQNNYKLVFTLNPDHLNIELRLLCEDKVRFDGIIEILKSKKPSIWQFLSSHKHVIIYADFPQKNKKSVVHKLTSIDISNKNYDAFIENVNNNISRDKYACSVCFGYNLPKNECIKQGKNLKNIAYDAVTSILSLEKDLIMLS
jgi:hypothetical protein